MSAIADFIITLQTTAKHLEEQFLVNQIERDSDGKLTYAQYAGALDENAEPEHLIEIDDAIRRALKMGWDPTDDRDHVCRYSLFLWNSVTSTYIRQRASEIDHEGEL